MPLLRKRTLLAAKVEAAVGTPETLAAANASFVVYDVEAKIDTEYIARPSQGTASKNPGVIGARGGSISFKIELTGAAALADIFFPSCGLADAATPTGTYALKTAAPGTAAGGLRTLTIGAYIDGRVKKFAGCMGNMKIIGEVGKPLVAEFEYKGVYVATTDEAIPTDTVPALIGPRVANGTFTLGGASPVLGSFEIDLKNEITLREDITAGGGESGYLSAIITDRDPVATFQQESALVATRDDYGIYLAGTTQALVVVVGSDAGNILTLSAPAAQISEINDEDKDGVLADALQLSFCRSAADDDEFTIAIS